MLQWFAVLSCRTSALAPVFGCIAMLAAPLPAAAQAKGETEPVRVKVLLGVVGPLAESAPARLAKALEADFPSGHGISGLDIETVTLIPDIRKLVKTKVPPGAVVLAIEQRSRELLREKKADAMIRVLGRPDGTLRLLFLPDQQLVAPYLELPADFKPGDAAFATGLLVLAASPKSTDPGLFMAAGLSKAVMGMQRALAERWDALPAEFQAPVRFTYGNLALIASQFKEDLALHEDAVASLRMVQKGWTRNEQPREWARAQMALGIALAALQQRKPDGSHFEEAVVALRAAQQVFTRERHPDLWAIAEANVGHALRERGARNDDPVILREAVTSLQRSLESMPVESTARLAALKGLGAALFSLGVDEGDKTLLKEAEAVFRKGLEAVSADTRPGEWGDLQRSLARVLTETGGRNEEALDIYRASISVFPHKDEPLIWGILHIDMANVLTRMGQEKASTKRYREAIAAYRSGLAEVTSERLPKEWADGTINLGVAQHLLGQQEKDAGLIGDAVEAYEAAGTVKTREKNASDWALLRANLGEAWGDIGVLKGDGEQIAKGIAMLREALQVRTRESEPYNWATDTGLLAKFLIRQTEQDGDKAHTTEAVSLLKEVIPYYKEKSEAEKVKEMQALLDEAGGM